MFPMKYHYMYNWIKFYRLDLFLLSEFVIIFYMFSFWSYNYHFLITIIYSKFHKLEKLYKINYIATYYKEKKRLYDRKRYNKL